jgi:hypothetical protein
MAYGHPQIMILIHQRHGGRRAWRCTAQRERRRSAGPRPRGGRSRRSGIWRQFRSCGQGAANGAR